MARFTNPGDGNGSGLPGPQGDPGPQGNAGADGSDGLNSLFLGTWNSVTEFLAAYQGGPVGLADGDWWAFVKDNTDPNKIYVVRENPASETGWVIDDNEHFVLPQGPQGDPGAAGADFGIYYLGNYNPSSGYVPNIAVVRGSDGQLYLAKASGQLSDPINYQTNGQWEIWIPKGADGSNGADGADGISFLWSAEFDPGTTYPLNYVVSYEGSSYIKVENGGDFPIPTNSTYWNLMSSKGDTGSTGADGTDGADALWNFTGAYNGGVSYAVGDVATYTGQTWYRKHANGGNLGDTPSEGTFWTLLAAQGDQGIQGAQGVQGPSGNSFTVLGSYADLTAFNAGAGGEPGTLGDAYILLSDGSLMVYGAEGWFDSGDLQGPQGIQGEQGPKGDTGATGAAGGFGSYGSWYDTQTQIVTTVSTGEPVKVRQQDIVSGFTRTNNSRITATNAGIYNLAFSFQFRNEGGGGNGQTVEIWLTKNGQAVADSNTRIAVNTNSPYVVAAWNFFQQMNAGDYLEIYWATDNKNVVMKTNTGAMGGPAIPSAIITVNQVG